MYTRDGLHLSGKGAAMFADELSAAVNSGLGSIKNIFGSKHCLRAGYLEIPQTGPEATSTYKPVTKCFLNIIFEFVKTRFIMQLVGCMYTFLSMLLYIVRLVRIAKCSGESGRVILSVI